MNPDHTRVRVLVGGMLIATTLSGCATATPPGSASDARAATAGAGKAGGAAGPLVIRVADSQEKGKPSNQPLAAFAGAVNEASGGSMRVEVSYDVGGEQTDGPVIDELSAGQTDMAVVAARSWVDQGVFSLRALQMPFVIASDAVLDTVAMTPAITDQLLSGLPDAGVHGVALLPDSLRHLFSFTTPIKAPADVSGRKVRGPASADSKAILSDWGGELVSPSYDEFVSGVAKGSITAAESSFVGATDEFTTASSTASNAVLYAKATTLVAGAKFWSSLTDDQQAVVAKAGLAAQAWAVKNRVREVAAAKGYCDKGGRAFLLDDAQLQTFATATKRMFDRAQGDGVTADVVAKIIKAGRSATPERIACGGSAPADPNAVKPVAGSFPPGTYRTEVTESALRRAGVGESDFDLNRGVFTITMRDGHYSVVRSPVPDPSVLQGAVLQTQTGVYAAKASTFDWVVRFQHEAADPYVIPLGFSVDPDGNVIVSYPVDGPSPYDRAFFSGKWTRVGG